MSVDSLKIGSVYTHTLNPNQGRLVQVECEFGYPESLDKAEFARLFYGKGLWKGTKQNTEKFRLKLNNFTEFVKPEPKIKYTTFDGEVVTVGKEFLAVLRDHLRYGQENVLNVEYFIEKLEIDDTDSNRRSLRAAKQYLLEVEELPVCSIASQKNGGYYIATSPENVYEAAREYQQRAEGAEKMANRLYAIAEKMKGF